MAKEEQLEILKQGVGAWNRWRKAESDTEIDLSNADLSDADLSGVDLHGADLSGAVLADATLRHANLCVTYLPRATLTGADLDHADCREVGLSEANLASASLRQTKLVDANLDSADLKDAKFNSSDLRRARLDHSNLRWTNFSFANLTSASFSSANLEGANLKSARLRRVDFSHAKLIEADLSSADLSAAKLNYAYLHLTKISNACFDQAQFVKTVIAATDLSETLGLHRCHHLGPSSVDYQTLNMSRNVPIGFWRGCGIPDGIIDFLPSLVDQAIQFYSCFISYSSKDQEFADRLHADLQDKGVRCWFAPHDLPIGAKTWDGIDQAIRTRDKVLLILSEGAISSDWVEDEVTAAFAEERRRDKLVLFPVRLDGAVMDTDEPWAGKLRDGRNIGDFSKWKDHDAYKATLDRVLRDLKASR